VRTSRSSIDAAVLFIGRGGSGTRLLSQLAADARIFVSNHVDDKSGDSKEWMDLIYRMVVEVGGRHDLPTGSRYRREIRATAERILADAPPCRSWQWGLKLPETMLVLPLLLDAFPRAKVIHLTRHPVPSSLRRAHLTSRLGNRVGNVALSAAYEFSGRDTKLITTDEAFLHNAYSWNFQVTRVLHYARDVLSGSQYLEVKYEDVCRRPDRVFETLQFYLGCVDRNGPTSVLVDPSRSGVWDPRDARVRAIWDICGETAERLGYTRDLVG
jgi:hypothetical protein